jgi:hypothetical protein
LRILAQGNFTPDRPQIIIQIFLEINPAPLAQMVKVGYSARSHQFPKIRAVQADVFYGVPFPHYCRLDSRDFFIFHQTQILIHWVFIPFAGMF